MEGKAALGTRINSHATFTVDSFANGIAFGQHRLEEGADPRDFYSLRMQDEPEMIRLRSRYALHKENPFHRLERNLMRLSRLGVLRSSTIYFGVTTDPFLPFEGKFDASIKFLELFQKYTPGQLIVQTRSPLIVVAMPVLRRLGKHATVTLGLETDDEQALQRYTPGLPRASERLRTATALRRFGVEVNLQVSPVLPYGDWKKDACRFAQTLVQHADHIFLRSITDGSERRERRIKSSPVVQRLAADRQYFYLRPDSALPLTKAIEMLAPEKLKLPARTSLTEKQLKMFAA
ncbi:MAG: hypothetical protein K1X83_09225 [Oligoflexia bacterium]|nr:hypothetical protein [Oligoflexia bacterium]